MIGQSPGMVAIYERIELLKDTDIVVMIQGETGTGKELVASALHEEGRRRGRPFVIVNCGGIVESLLESLMFGYARGAFSGAYRDTPGWVEVAEDGTLFLDEVADLPLSLQVKLLRVLDGGGFQRVGEQGVTRQFRARVIAATHADLQEMVAEKRFREDLYYRLSVARIDLPPLRTRREDIPALTDLFLEGARRKVRRSISGITPAARSLFLQHPWKGNVRQLQHVIEAAATLVPDGAMIDVPQIQAQFRDEPVPAGLADLGGTLEAALAGFERAFVERTVNDFGWNISAAAKAIGISRQHFHNLIRKYQLARPSR
jgi:transcriptional regulator with PAS, ATPase and Fis domain